MVVKTTILYRCFSAAIHVEHGIQLLKYFEAVHQFVAAALDIASIHSFRRAAKITDQGVVECDDKSDDGGLSRRSLPICEGTYLIGHRSYEELFEFGLRSA